MAAVNGKGQGDFSHTETFQTLPIRKSAYLFKSESVTYAYVVKSLHPLVMGMSGQISSKNYTRDLLMATKSILLKYNLLENSPKKQMCKAHPVSKLLKMYAVQSLYPGKRTLQRGH